jgi:SAM-dependent methyltransferase
MTEVIPVAVSNRDQLGAWDGDEGAVWAREPDRFDRSVADYHQPLLAAARIGRSSRVLDVGCGTGQTTRDAARLAVEGSALGVDLSSQMLGVARRLAEDEGVRNATFVHGDAQVYPFPRCAFDVLLSRTGTMFFGDRDAAFHNLARALKPGARLAIVVWQPLRDNEWVREIMTTFAAGRNLPTPPPDAPGPFSMSDPAGTIELLQDCGFRDVHVTGLTGRMRLGTDVDDANPFVLAIAGWALDGLDEPTRASALQAMRTSLAAHQSTDGVAYESRAWLVTGERGD